MNCSSALMQYFASFISLIYIFVSILFSSVLFFIFFYFLLSQINSFRPPRRVSPAVASLVALDVDPRSTAAYGIAHILAALTVSNHELKAKALADKEVSMEQYNQLQELARIKTTDEFGNKIEEKKNDDDDEDSPELVRRRIQRIVANNAIPFLLKLLVNSSAQTVEATARALRQICVEESIRGLFVQLGGLKACTTVSVDDSIVKSTRRESSHAIAKALVTTNPSLLSEHVRLGAITPLLLLCRDVDATNLQQFEALLALTNLTSCGAREQEHLVAEKGVSSVHYLMFSDHAMVRRAATEVLCNMPLHDAVLKVRGVVLSFSSFAFIELFMYIYLFVISMN